MTYDEAIGLMFEAANAANPAGSVVMRQAMEAAAEAIGLREMMEALETIKRLRGLHADDVAYVAIDAAEKAYPTATRVRATSPRSRS